MPKPRKQIVVDKGKYKVLYSYWHCNASEDTLIWVFLLRYNTHNMAKDSLNDLKGNYDHEKYIVRISGFVFGKMVLLFKILRRSK